MQGRQGSTFLPYTEEIGVRLHGRVGAEDREGHPSVAAAEAAEWLAHPARSGQKLLR